MDDLQSSEEAAFVVEDVLNIVREVFIYRATCYVLEC
jgi:hypothetical protein